jgi:hypothetical protein
MAPVTVTCKVRYEDPNMNQINVIPLKHHYKYTSKGQKTIISSWVCVSVHLKLCDKLTNFHKTWYEYNATAGHHTTILYNIISFQRGIKRLCRSLCYLCTSPPPPSQLLKLMAIFMKLGTHLMPLEDTPNAMLFNLLTKTWWM